MIIKLISALFFLVFIATPAFANHILIAEGIPLQKSLCDINGCQNIPLSKEDKDKFKMLIYKEGKKILWGSRDNKELSFIKDDDLSVFVAPGGEGYIRIATEDGKTIYVEHLTMGFKNVTYWGVVTFKQFK